MSRRALDDYLRAGDPLGLAGAAAPEPRGAAPRRRPRLIPLFAGGGAVVAALALAVVLLLTGTPGGRDAPSFLSPQAAVAAAARTLETDHVLHWVTVAEPANQNFADHRKGATSDGRTELWVDLKTLASHQIYASQTPCGPAVGPEEAWYNGQRSFWVKWPTWAFIKRPDGRQVVMRTVRRRGEKILITRSPLDDVRDTLALAASGKATLREMPAEHGVPIVRIRQTAFSKDGAYKNVTMTWITREASPRLLRTVYSIRYRGEKTRTTTTTTTTWELLPRDAAALSHVAVPHFDPAKIVVRTQFLGPPKR